MLSTLSLVSNMDELTVGKIQNVFICNLFSYKKFQRTTSIYSKKQIANINHCLISHTSAVTSCGQCHFTDISSNVSLRGRENERITFSLQVCTVIKQP